MLWLKQQTLSLFQYKQRRKYLLGDSLLAIVSALVVTGCIDVFQLYPRIPNISLVYLLVVLALASTRGLYAAVLASVVAFLSFDYFLVPPFFTLNITKFEEWLALFVFLVTAILTAELASALRLRANQARQRERETRILYELVRDTNNEEDLDHQLGIVARSIADVFAQRGVQDCAIFLTDEHDKLTLRASARQPAGDVELMPDEAATAAWVMHEAQMVELHDVSLVPPTAPTYALRAVVRSTKTNHAMRRYIRLIPLKIGQKPVGVLRLVMEDDPRLFALERSIGVNGYNGQGGRNGNVADPNTAFFNTFVDQAASMIERARLRRESLQIEVLRRTDELRSALISSVSHDLRTPLTSIKAAASSLLQEDVQWDEETRRSFTLSIEREADRLNRLVENLLDMSRIEAGALKPEKEWYPLDELFNDVLSRMQPQLQGREVKVDVPPDLPPVQLDYMEIDQVLTNLIENATRYTPPGSPIEISARASASEMHVTVADRGPGIPVEALEHIFDKFFRVHGRTSGLVHYGSSGLGLAVSKGLIEAHGGRIWAENREGGGAILHFTLPLSLPTDSA